MKFETRAIEREQSAERSPSDANLQRHVELRMAIIGEMPQNAAIKKSRAGEYVLGLRLQSRVR